MIINSAMRTVTYTIILFMIVFIFIGCASKKATSKIPLDEQYIKGILTRLGDPKPIDTLKVSDHIGPPYKPNPFCPTTTTIFQVPNEDSVTITYYDPIGNIVCEAYRGYLSSGEYKFEPKDVNLNSGVYFIECRVGKRKCVQKALIIR